jgi:predicted HTH domain antitoxin
MPRRVELELPDELLELFESEDVVARAAREALVLDLLNRGEISHGKAAELLDIDRWELPDLLARHGLPILRETPEELRQDVENLRRVLKS